MKKQLLSTILGLLALSGTAQAQFNDMFQETESTPIRFYFEPKVGLGSAGVKYSENGTTSNQSGANTFFVSSILGWYANDIYFGLDLRYDNAMSAVEQNSKKEALNIFSAGIGFGYTLEYVPVRWYLSLDLQQRAWASSDAMSSGFVTGGYRAGLSYYVSDKMLVNFDMSEPVYLSGSGSSLSGVEAKIYGISFSLPMDFERSTTPWRERRGYVSDAKPDSAIKNLDIKDEFTPTNTPNTTDSSLVDEAIDDVATEKQSTPPEATSKSDDFGDDLQLENKPETSEEPPTPEIPDSPEESGSDDGELEL